MSVPPLEFVTTECPNGHRVRGDLGWLDREVRCPHCHAGFVFRRPDANAAEVVALDGSSIDKPQIEDPLTLRQGSVSDTGVMRILGSLSTPSVPEESNTLHCTECGATYPSDISLCFNCNLPLKSIADSATVDKAPEEIDFRPISAFPFDDVPIKKRMRPRKQITFLDINDPLPKVIACIRETRHGVYPICDRSLDGLLGCVAMEEMIFQNEGEFDLLAMASKIDRFEETVLVSEALQRMCQKKARIAMVVDEYDTVIGMVTAKDMILNLLRK